MTTAIQLPAVLLAGNGNDAAVVVPASVPACCTRVMDVDCAEPRAPVSATKRMKRASRSSGIQCVEALRSGIGVVDDTGMFLLRSNIRFETFDMWAQVEGSGTSKMWAVSR